MTSAQISSLSSYANQRFKQLSLNLIEVEDSEFYDCSFANCSMVEVLLRGCRFVNCLFTQCDLSLAQITKSRFITTRFVDSRLVGINWTLADWSAGKLQVPVAYHNCAVNYGTFIGLSLPKLEMTDCSALDVDFREADLSQADFSGTDLTRTIFDNTNLAGADLSLAQNYHIDPGRNIVKQAKFAMPEAMSLLYSLDINLIDKDQ